MCQVELHGDKTFTSKQQKYRVSEALKTGEATVLFDACAPITYCLKSNYIPSIPSHDFGNLHASSINITHDTMLPNSDYLADSANAFLTSVTSNADSEPPRSRLGIIPPKPLSTLIRLHRYPYPSHGSRVLAGKGKGTEKKPGGYPGHTLTTAKGASNAYENIYLDLSEIDLLVRFLHLTDPPAEVQETIRQQTQEYARRGFRTLGKPSTMLSRILD